MVTVNSFTHDHSGTARMINTTFVYWNFMHTFIYSTNQPTQVNLKATMRMTVLVEACLAQVVVKLWI